MRSFYGYVRVSTVRQGEHGVSLQEQRSAIEQYAHRNGFRVVEWFEELETAAHTGRRIFTRMMRALRARKAEGVILHKIDRGARNLRDWIDLSTLADIGVQVRFTNDNLDLASRGGRLAADIQAVVAADYIRNLREETKKGFYGRIKQGILPLPAPLGYLDCGKGKPKAIDPVQGPIVRKAFELYATGRYSQVEVLAEVNALGLRNRRGRPFRINAFSYLMRNPFYIGLIHLKKTRETFPGAHEPLVSKALFDIVQALLEGRTPQRAMITEHRFARLFACATCGYSVIAERQRQKLYYRCHTPECRGVCIREEAIDVVVSDALESITLSDDSLDALMHTIDFVSVSWQAESERILKTLDIEIAALRERLRRLTDAFVDGHFDKAIYEDRKLDVLMKLAALEERAKSAKTDATVFAQQARSHLERSQAACFLYKTGNLAQQRETLLLVTSNRRVVGKNVDITLSPGFRVLADFGKFQPGAPSRKKPRIDSEIARNTILAMMGFDTSSAPADAHSLSSAASAPTQRTDERP